MSATQEHNCTCGRSFSTEQSLGRHCWVTGHAQAAAAVVAPVVEVVAEELPTEAVSAEVAYSQAMEVLYAKRLEQERYENQVQVQDFVEWAGESVYQGIVQTAVVARTAASSSLSVARSFVRAMLLVLLMLGLAAVGMGVGSVVASAASSPVSQSVASSIVAQS